ncbi:hypothetical protein NKE57_10370, partial [Streptococcus suis]
MPLLNEEQGRRLIFYYFIIHLTGNCSTELLIFLFGLLTKAYYFSLRRRDATATVPNKAKPTNASADVLS